MSLKRRMISQVKVGKIVDGEPDGMVLIYAMGDQMTLVVTSRTNGDAELFLNRDEAARVASAIQNACDQLPHGS